LIAETIYMTLYRLAASLSGVLALCLAACSVPINAYHKIEGGAIAQTRQAPPGADQPYPNLANVPPEPKALAPGAQAAITAAVHNGTGVSPASPTALAGLALPTAPPPAPNLPGLTIPNTPSSPPPALAQKAAPPHPPGAAIAFAFPPHTAILPATEAAPLAALAASRGAAKIRVGGFGDGTSLSLALARARRLADALTAAGVPPAAITLTAATAGSGGFVQLVY
jgi:hypothetical protein